MNSVDNFPLPLVTSVESCESIPMAHPPDNDDVEIVTLALPLDRETVSWLARMSRNDVEAAEMVAWMIQQIRRDDEAAKQTLH